MIEDNKSKFESIFDDCRKQNLLSQNSEKYNNFLDISKYFRIFASDYKIFVLCT